MEAAAQGGLSTSFFLFKPETSGHTWPFFAARGVKCWSSSGGVGEAQPAPRPAEPARLPL